MVEEKKLDEGKKAEEIKEEAAAKVEEDEPKKEEEEPEPEPEEIILKVDMHCEACARKVARALKGFQGVDEVKANYRVSKVVVKGKEADPVKVAERIHKKSGRKVEIISPLPKPDDQENKLEAEEPPKEEKKEEPPAVITVVLKVRMHCGPCAQLLQKKIGKIKGVESVTTDILSDQVIVKGVVDPEKLVNDVYKRTGKQASIVKEEENKDDIEKKEEDDKKKKKDDEKQDDDKKKQEEEEEDDDDTKMELKKRDYWETKYYVDYAAASANYPPPDLMFSDENPNACYVM